MNQEQKNKQFYLKYHGSLSGKKKTREMITKYVEDEKLIGHILFFEKLFPEYSAEIDELLADGDRIFARVHMVGKHKGEADGIPATHKTVDTPFALGYKIKNKKIVDFWAIGDELELFKQMGLSEEHVNFPKK